MIFVLIAISPWIYCFIIFLSNPGEKAHFIKYFLISTLILYFFFNSAGSSSGAGEYGRAFGEFFAKVFLGFIYFILGLIGIYRVNKNSPLKEKKAYSKVNSDILDEEYIESPTPNKVTTPKKTSRVLSFFKVKKDKPNNQNSHTPKQ